MRSINQVTITGRITDDPKIKETNAGPVCNFSLAVSTGKKDDSGVDGVDFFNVSAWKKSAENIAQYCRKGDMLGVSGKLTQSTWTDNENKKRSSVEIMAFDVVFLGKAKNSAGHNPAPPPPDAASATDSDDMPF